MGSHVQERDVGGRVGTGHAKASKICIDEAKQTKAKQANVNSAVATRQARLCTPYTQE